jgi:murein DD-endopeptidase MepM/ murein hydrolase activator NlpD
MATNHVQDFISQRKGGFQPYNLDTSSQGISEAQRQTALMSQALQSQMEAMRRKQEEEMLRRQQEEQQRQQQEIPQYLVGSTENTPNMSTENGPVYVENNKQYATSETVLPGQAPVTQAFGVYNPGVEVFGSDGRNYGVDFGIKEGTPIALPPGDWEVVDAYGEGKNKGYIGDKTNSGYGNSVLVRNLKTGETMRFSHLSQAKVQSGQKLSGGTVIGLSGMTGNVTGPHLDLEYKVNGQFRDITRSPYANNLFGQGGGSVNTYKRIPMGGGIDEIKSNFKYMGENLKNFAKNIGSGIKRDVNLLKESQKQMVPLYGRSALEMAADSPQAQQLASKVPGGEFVRSMLGSDQQAMQGMEYLRVGRQVTPEQRSSMNNASLIKMTGMIASPTASGARSIGTLPSKKYTDDELIKIAHERINLSEKLSQKFKETGDEIYNMLSSDAKNDAVNIGNVISSSGNLKEYLMNKVNTGQFNLLLDPTDEIVQKATGKVLGVNTRLLRNEVSDIDRIADLFGKEKVLKKTDKKIITDYLKDSSIKVDGLNERQLVNKAQELANQADDILFNIKNKKMTKS